MPRESFKKSRVSNQKALKSLIEFLCNNLYLKHNNNDDKNKFETGLSIIQTIDVINMFRKSELY